MIMIARCFAFVVVAVGVLLASPAWSQEPAKAAKEPTLEETAAWLKEKIERYGDIPALPDVPARQAQAVTLFQFDGCLLTIQLESTYPGLGRTITAKRSIPLKELNPAQVKVIPDGAMGLYRVRVVTTGERKIIKSQGRETDKKKPPEDFEETSAYFSFLVKDGDVADRIATALQHAIALCGGKAEPF